MPVSDLVRKELDVAAQAAVDKLGTDLVAIDLSEKPVRRENGEEWILIDYSDLVVHVQTENLRRYYLLDRLWNDCPTIPLHVDETR